MAFIRKEQKRNYTHISNDVFNSGLSMKARGLLCTMLSLPDSWEFSENGLQGILNDGQTAIRSAIRELEEHGFMKRERERDELGRMSRCVWVVCDYPRFENHNLVSANLDNRPQLTTKESTTNKSTTKRDIRPQRHKHGEYQNVLLTDEELSKLKAEFPTDWNSRIESLSSYMASTGKAYKNHLSTIRNWALRDERARKEEPKAYRPSDDTEWEEF